jgi:chromosome segregation protein
MKLTKLTLDGFKSFGQRTEINFDDGITVLVGPNGCGKSNVVDAIKWVLGERSIKSLRSEEMLDVIFNGTTDVNPSGYAEVSLSFSNSDGKSRLPLNYEEVTVTRRLYRSGESEYLINNQTCRLKDIRELFMGTGIGMEFYSIIEQGRVDFILRSNPLERRELFDEAAGISKYKSKRRESEMKLQKVEQDLIRLQDILREVRREIRSIKIQATKAEKYKNTLEELKAKKTQLALHAYHQYHQKRLELSDKLTQLKALGDSLEKKLYTVEEVIIAIDKEIIQIDNDIASHNNVLIGLSGRISETKQKIESSSLRQQELIAEEEKTRRNLASDTQKTIDLRNRLCEIMQSYEVIKKELESSSEEFDEKNSFYIEFVKEINENIKNLEIKRNEIFQVTHKKSIYQNELSTIQNELKNLSLKREKFSGRRKEIENETELLKQNNLKSEFSYQEIQKVITNLKQDLSQREMVLAALKNDSITMSNESNKIKDESNRISSRKEVLEDLENHHEGCSSSVRSVLDASSSMAVNIYGLVADIVEVKPEYVNAAEAGLKGLADAIIIRSQDDALKIIQFVYDNQKGRITVIALDRLKNFSLRPPIPQSNIVGVIGYADEIIQSIKIDDISLETKSALSRILLGQYLLVDNIKTAQQIISEHIYDGQILTINGEIINSDGLFSGGFIEAGMGLISRKTELRYLEGILMTLSVQLTNFEQLQNNKKSEIEAYELDSQKLRNIIYERSVEMIDLEKSISEINRRISIITKEIEINDLEHSEVEQQINALSERGVTTAQVIYELEKCLEKLQSEIEQLNNSINESTKKKQILEAQITELKVRQAKLLSNKEHFLQQQTQLTSDIQQLEITLNSSAESLDVMKTKISELHFQKQSDESLLKELFNEEVKIQTLMGSLKNNIRELKNKFHSQKTEEEKIQSEIKNIQSNFNELNIEERELLLKIENICDKHKEEAGDDLKELYLSYRPSVEMVASQNISDWQQINDSIEELKKRLGEMTDVNLSAIDQLKSLEERNDFLSTQEQDLIKSKESLHDFIRKTNRECREKFETTFELIRSNFNQLFRKLFGGGRAELLLEKPYQSSECETSNGSLTQTQTANQSTIVNSAELSGQDSSSKEIMPEKRNDVLECGIEIIAKPPGKEPASIRLLSGGEKTLTAFALTMAIFQLQPSPFCILDEADSALDENNVDRFSGLINDFAKETQFIVITHNKKTMLSGDRLYGVTMPTPGISTKISVKMEDIERFISEIPEELLPTSQSVTVNVK